MDSQGMAERLMTVSGAIEPTMVRISPGSRPKLRMNYLICSIDVSAFVGIMFVLLFIFMVRTPIDLVRPAVDLTKVVSPIRMRAADKEDAMIVAVTREGKVYFRMENIRVEDLPSKIHEGLSQGAENKVYVLADARSKYGTVKEVLDGVRDAGIEHIGFLVDQRKPQPLMP